jgi:hypothetical protein
MLEVENDKQSASNLIRQRSMRPSVSNNMHNTRAADSITFQRKHTGDEQFFEGVQSPVDLNNQKSADENNFDHINAYISVPYD